MRYEEGAPELGNGLKGEEHTRVWASAGNAEQVRQIHKRKATEADLLNRGNVVSGGDCRKDTGHSSEPTEEYRNIFSNRCGLMGGGERRAD